MPKQVSETQLSEAQNYCGLPTPYRSYCSSSELPPYQLRASSYFPLDSGAGTVDSKDASLIGTSTTLSLSGSSQPFSLSILPTVINFRKLHVINCESVNNQVIPQPHQSEINRMDLPDFDTGSIEVPNSAHMGKTQYLGAVEHMRMRYFEQLSEQQSLRTHFCLLLSTHQENPHQKCTTFAFNLRFVSTRQKYFPQLLLVTNI